MGEQGGKGKVKGHNIRTFDMRKNDNYAKKLKSRLRRNRLLMVGSLCFVGAVIYRRRPDLVSIAGSNLRLWSKELRNQVFTHSIMLQVRVCIYLVITAATLLHHLLLLGYFLTLS